MSDAEMDRWQRRAAAVTITRDDWGIAHVDGSTDADAVFGLMYCQAEDDFPRIEANYLSALGMSAMVHGEQAIFRDLRVRLFNDATDLKSRYVTSPPWLRELMDAWADGLNYYLATHPMRNSSVIARFEPWMALSFTEGGILGDIGRVSVEELEHFYNCRNAVGGEPEASAAAHVPPTEWQGSNAVAVSPSRSQSGGTLLLINPHPEFYFRCEVHVRSAEGLNCYGAVTWGQFFVYQGFNDRLGWGLTTSGVDTVDEYAETICERDGNLYYRHGDLHRSLERHDMRIAYRTTSNSMAERVFPVYRTHHGPIVRERNGEWISVSLMYKPVEALTQGFQRMKARDYREFVNVSDLKANSIANAVYADAEGNIAFWPPTFVPRRSTRFNFVLPVDGADPETDWRGEHELVELPHVLNPASGYVANVNDSPYVSAGPGGPQRERFPDYMDTAGENPRSDSIRRIFEGRGTFTLASLVEAAYESHLSAFAKLMPSLLADYDRLGPADSLRPRLAAQISALREWNCRPSVDSSACTLAILWGEQLLVDIDEWASRQSGEWSAFFDYVLRGRLSVSLTFRSLNEILSHMIHGCDADTRLMALDKAIRQLEQDFGTWQVPWGVLNRFQRVSGEVVQCFHDDAPSVPVPLTSSLWGALACFKTRKSPGTKRRYGVSGNGFVAAVEFGARVRARAIVVGGASADPQSPHFNDQGARFATGGLREVYFHPDEIEGHVERVYRPGA